MLQSIFSVLDLSEKRVPVSTFVIVSLCVYVFIQIQDLQIKNRAQDQKMQEIQLKVNDQIIEIKTIMIKNYDKIDDKLNKIIDKSDHRTMRQMNMFLYEIVRYGLKDAINQNDKIFSLIQKWIEKKWGAQLMSLKVLCIRDPEILESLMDNATQVKICRMMRNQ